MAAVNEIDPIKWEAAQWVERRMDDGPFDDSAFGDWIAEDPRHQSAFDIMWRRIMGPELGVALHDYGRRKAARRTALASVAAVLMVVAGGYKAMPFVVLQLTTPTEFAAADGTAREISLEDGTRLTLGGGASVKVRYTGHDRVIELSQGALFAHVVHDERRPFRIETGDAEIVDIGTSFEVVSKPSSVRVTVAEGIVDFARSGWFRTPVRLDANEAALLDQAGLNRLPNVGAGDVAPWRGEWVEYKGETLREVVADLRSLSPVPIEIASQRLGDQPVSGRIRLTDPMGQLENLSVIQGFNIRKTEDRIIVY
ncbi:FecR family protein [Sphingobium aquiterrae]|uniref:FecR family protein n=1 Tax=Sphingobium aquiterrae TaxID=2038656 RepID=UPI0030172043